ncbi:MAG TPA: PilZ domain-containing protein [Planctomycetota bacterium]|nr:PilZ domain-containing protein [Planctomycetota bacterium]
MGQWDATTAVVDDGLDPEIGLVFEPNRRAFPRLSAREITWLRTARLKYGPSVSLIDLSVRGALFETKLQLRPGSESALELTGRGAQTVMPFRVVRCQVSDLTGGLRYRGACAFKRPLDLLDLQPPVATNSDEVDFLKDSPSGWSKVIVRYADGKLLKGYTQDFRPARMHFHLWPSMAATASERMMVPLPLVKAVFFVRDFTGNPAHVEGQAFDKLRHGRRVEVTFLDREVIVGSTLNYQPDGDGFFVLPADARSNNMRIFVVSGSVRHVRFP